MKTVQDVMAKNVKVVSPGASLTEAAKMMDELNIGDLPVCDGEKLVGIITDRDIVIRSVSAGLDPNTTQVRDSMTSPVIYCYEDQDLSLAARTMEEQQIRRLPIISRENRLVGIVTLKDVAPETKAA